MTESANTDVASLSSNAVEFAYNYTTQNITCGDARLYCMLLDSGGGQSWRLPTIAEIKTHMPVLHCSSTLWIWCEDAPETIPELWHDNLDPSSGVSIRYSMSVFNVEIDDRNIKAAVLPCRSI